MEGEDSCDAVGACGARLMGSVGAESQEEVGEGMGMVQEGGGGRGGKERGKCASTCRV